MATVVISSETPLVDKTSAQTITGPKTFQAGSATSVPVTVSGTSGQTANLVEFKDAIGLVRGSMSGGGTLKSERINIGDMTMIGDTSAIAAFIKTRSPQNYGLIVRGNTAQTSDLQQWQNSMGTVRTKIQADGNLHVGYFQDERSVSINFDDSNVAALAVISGSSTKPGLVVRARQGGSSNLAEFQDYYGTVETRIDSLGNYYSGRAIIAGTSAGTGYFGAQVNVVPAAASNKGVVIRGASGQYANLIEYQDPAGNVLSWIGSGGGLIIGGVGETGAYSSPGAYLNVQTRRPATKALEVRGQAGQTANLTEWQNSAGGVVAGFNNSGQMIFSTSNASSSAAGGPSSAMPSNPEGYLHILTTGGAVKKVPYFN